MQSYWTDTYPPLSSLFPTKQNVSRLSLMYPYFHDNFSDQVSTVQTNTSRLNRATYTKLSHLSFPHYSKHKV